MPRNLSRPAQRSRTRTANRAQQPRSATKTIPTRSSTLSRSCRTLPLLRTRWIRRGRCSMKRCRQNRMSVDVGVDGTTITGTSPDRSKGVTVLLFTEGKAFVSLEFDGPSYALAPPEFIHRRRRTSKTPRSKRDLVASAVRRLQCPGSNSRGSVVGPVIPVSCFQCASPPERGLGMRLVMMRRASMSSSRARCEPRQ